MDDVVNAIATQERLFLQIDENGWMGRLTGLKDRQQMIKDFAK